MRWILWAYVLGYIIIGEERYFHKVPGHGPLAVKLMNNSYAYTAGAGAEKSPLSFTAFDSVDLVAPFLESGAIFVITQVQKTQGQTRENHEWRPKPQSKMVTLSFDVENVKLRYAAFVSFPLIDPSGKKRFQTKGELQSSGHSQNELVLSEILHIANIKFTDIAVSGAVLQVSVLWNCFLLISNCSPEIQVSRLDSSTPGFSVWRTNHYTTKDGKQRDVEKCTGIRLLWRSVGSGNQIDLVSIIFNLAAGVALLPIAAFITEFVMLFVLPERRHYSHDIFEETPDYSMLDEKRAEREAEEERRKEEQSAVDVEALFAHDLEQDAS